MAASKIVGYYTSWSNYRQGAGKFTVANINPNLFTHLIYSFAVLDQGTLKISMHDPNLDQDGYVRFTNLKQQNPNLKTMIAIGGWNDSQTQKYNMLTQSDDKMRAFAAHAVTFLRQYNFDGLDIDWEHPANEQQKAGYVKWLQFLKSAFSPHGLLLTAAVPGSSYSVNNGYNISGIAQCVDFINLMSYDFHGASWEPNTADHHSRLYPSTNDAVCIWMNGGMPRNKIVVGMPAYGQAWTLANAGGTPIPPTSAVGPAGKGPYTQESGTLSYYEICEKIRNGWTNQDDPAGPYAYCNNQWVGYDTVASFAAKAKYVKDGGYGGAMVWEISYDDFGGMCGPQYPLISQLKTILG